MRYAEILNNTVINLIEANPGIDWPFESYLIEILDNEYCEINYLFDSNSNPRFIKQNHQLVFTAYQFMLRLTLEERAAIRNAAITDIFVADFLQLAQAAQEIDTSNPMTLQGMDYLVSVGLLTEQRKNEILGL